MAVAMRIQVLSIVWDLGFGGWGWGDGVVLCYVVLLCN